MNLRINSEQSISKSRNKYLHPIMQISLLAKEVRTEIDENQQLTTTINILKRLVEKNKNIIKKLTSYNNISKSEVEKGLEELKKELILLNKSLKEEKNIISLKYSKESKEMNQTLYYLKNELGIIDNRKFMFENSLSKKESIIKKVKEDLNNLCKPPFPMVKEKKREKYISSYYLDDKYSDILEKFQIDLMSHCKSFNKLKNKCFLLNKNEELLLEELNKMKNNENSYKEDIKEKEKGIKIQENLDKINEEDSFLNETFSSINDEEYFNTSFPLVINKKSIIEKKNFHKTFNMPELYLKQIIYNKNKHKKEYSEKSLSRNIKKWANSKDIKIKKMKKEIKKIKKDNKLKVSKCQEFEKKIRIMENYIQNTNLIKENKNRLETEIRTIKRPYLIY